MRPHSSYILEYILIFYFSFLYCYIDGLTLESSAKKFCAEFIKPL